MDGVNEEVAAWTLDGDALPYIPVDELTATSNEGLEATPRCPPPQ
jgi:hypothetical protein